MLGREIRHRSLSLDYQLSLSPRAAVFRHLTSMVLSSPSPVFRHTKNALVSSFIHVEVERKAKIMDPLCFHAKAVDFAVFVFVFSLPLLSAAVITLQLLQKDLSASHS